jgi:hypothetical protein
VGFERQKSGSQPARAARRRTGSRDAQSLWGKINAVAISPDNHRLVTCGRDYTVQLRDLTKVEDLPEPQSPILGADKARRPSGVTYWRFYQKEQAVRAFLLPLSPEGSLAIRQEN